GGGLRGARGGEPRLPRGRRSHGRRRPARPHGGRVGRPDGRAHPGGLRRPQRWIVITWLNAWPSGVVSVSVGRILLLRALCSARKTVALSLTGTLKVVLPGAVNGAARPSGLP